MKTLLLSLTLVAQALTTGLEIRVIAEQAPVEGLHLTLTTYTYEEGEAIIREIVECDTNAQGACALILSKPNQEGMQYSTLQFGDYGTQDITWPGGMLELTIPLENLGFGREAAPYEFQIEDGGVVVRRRGFPLYAVLMAILLVVIFWLVYHYSKKTESNQ